MEERDNKLNTPEVVDIKKQQAGRYGTAYYFSVVQTDGEPENFVIYADNDIPPKEIYGCHKTVTTIAAEQKHNDIPFYVCKALGFGDFGYKCNMNNEGAAKYIPENKDAAGNLTLEYPPTFRSLVCAAKYASLFGEHLSVSENVNIQKLVETDKYNFDSKLSKEYKEFCEHAGKGVDISSREAVLSAVEKLSSEWKEKQPSDMITTCFKLAQEIQDSVAIREDEPRRTRNVKVKEEDLYLASIYTKTCDEMARRICEQSKINTDENIKELSKALQERIYHLVLLPKDIELIRSEGDLPIKFDRPLAPFVGKKQDIFAAILDRPNMIVCNAEDLQDLATAFIRYQGLKGILDVKETVSGLELTSKSGAQIRNVKAFLDDNLGPAKEFRLLSLSAKTSEDEDVILKPSGR